MDTLEAKATIVGLWPTNFRTPQWQQQLVDLLETWDALERRQVIEKLKGTHNGKRVSLETLRAVRAGLNGNSKPGGPNLANREQAAEAWLSSEGLLEAYQALDYGDRIMIERLVWSLVNRPGWEALLSRQAGPAKYWQPWERIEHLVFAASKATADGAPLCYPKQRGGRGNVQPWQPPAGNFVLGLPPLPVWFSDEERLAGLNRQSAIGDKFGGLKLGNFGRIFASKEYQAYLADYERRYLAAFERQHGAIRDDGEIPPPATRPLDLPKNLPPEKQMVSKRKQMDLTGATPEFLDLVGAEHPVPESGPQDTAANQTTSPLAASDDFSDSYQRAGSEAAE